MKELGVDEIRSRELYANFCFGKTVFKSSHVLQGTSYSLYFFSEWNN